MELAINKLFNKDPWKETISNAGSISYEANPENGQPAGDLVRCTGDAVSQATVHADFSLSPGETITVDVLARNIPGAGIEGSFYLESPIGVRVAEMYVTGDTMRDQGSLVWTSPFNESFAATPVRIVFGSASTRDSDCEFYRPRIKVHGGILASRRVLMDGAIEIVGGAYTLIGDTGFNVDTVVRNAPTGEVEIRPHMEAATSGYGVVHLTSLRATNAKKYLIEARYLPSTGKILVGFFDPVTSAAVDVNALDGTQRFNFTVFI